MRSAALISILAFVLIATSCAQCEKSKEKIIIRTELGKIHARLDLRRAPLTSANFLNYVDAGLFDSTCFYRVVRNDNQPDDSILIEVIQGGRFNNEEEVFPPIIHETTEITGIRHRNRTISMARAEPGTATSEFFICVGDQPELDYGGKRNPDRQGFAAFGKITRGMNVVRSIHSIKSPRQYLVTPVIIFDIKRSRFPEPGHGH